MIDAISRLIDRFFNLLTSPIGWLILIGIVVAGYLLLKGPKGAR